jgi:hypothetical protein
VFSLFGFEFKFGYKNPYSSSSSSSTCSLDFSGAIAIGWLGILFNAIPTGSFFTSFSPVSSAFRSGRIDVTADTMVDKGPPVPVDL